MLYLTDKSVLRLSGNVEKFMQGLTSNTLDRPRNAFVTIHGRIVATFDQVRAGDDAVLIVVEPGVVEPLRQHVAKYLLINRTRVEALDLRVYFDLAGDVTPTEGEYVIAQQAGQLWITAREASAEVSDEAFRQFRVAHNIPRQGVDYTHEFLLNVSAEEFVSYSKGCFLGQEPIAKVHNRSRPSRVLAACFADELTPEQRAKMTSTVIDPESGRERGFVFLDNKPDA